MRNPLNSIIAMNLKKRTLYNQLKELAVSNEINSDDIIHILRELFEGQDVQDASAKFMNFLAQDLLDFGQINASKFRFNYSQFSIIDSVREVMNIQKIKAEMSRIQLTCEFINISEERTRDNFSPQIYHDEQRIQQVLLNFQSNALKFTKGGRVNIKVEIRKSHGASATYLS